MRVDSQNHLSVEQRFAIDAFKKGMAMSQVFKVIEQYKELHKEHNMTNAIRIEDNEFYKFIINDICLGRGKNSTFSINTTLLDYISRIRNQPNIPYKDLELCAEFIIDQVRDGSSYESATLAIESYYAKLDRIGDDTIIIVGETLSDNLFYKFLLSKLTNNV